MKTLELAPNMGELLPALERENVSTIISRQVQPMALKVLVNKGFSVYKSIGDLLDENICLLIKVIPRMHVRRTGELRLCLLPILPSCTI